MIPIVNMMNNALKSSSDESEEVFESSLDALNLLLYVAICTQRSFLSKKKTVITGNGQKIFIIE